MTRWSTKEGAEGPQGEDVEGWFARMSDLQKERDRNTPPRCVVWKALEGAPRELHNCTHDRPKQRRKRGT